MLGTRRDSRPGLRLPNVTVTSARTAAASTSPVEASTPLGTSTATTVASEGIAADDRGGLGPKSAPTADAQDAVDDQVGLVEDVGRGSTYALPLARSAASPAGCGARGDEYGVDAGASASEGRAGEQRVTAVVAGADEQDDAGAVDPSQRRGAA